MANKQKKSKCCNAEIETQYRYSGSRLFEYCKKCHRRQDLLPIGFIQKKRQAHREAINGFRELVFELREKGDFYSANRIIELIKKLI